MAEDASTPDKGWPLRTWVLAALGALLALAIQQIDTRLGSDPAWRDRLAPGLGFLLGVGGVAFGLIWERGRLAFAVSAALVAGVIAAGTFLWSGMPGEARLGPDWYLTCGLLASALTLVLFQAMQDGDGATVPSRSFAGLRERLGVLRYPAVHGHLWSNALLLGASALFTALVFGIAHLLAEMFWLVRLGFLRDLLRESAFTAALVGAGFGAALGLLRDRGPIIAALRRVAMLVLRVLAPVLAVGIFLFLGALPFTGLAPLWETGGTTPIMLTGAMLALFLVNAVVGDAPEDESRSVVLSASAAALGLFLLPMVGIAAFSSGLRIHQHGLSPDRLWALTFIIVASVTAIAYAVAILGARGWFGRLRRTNLHFVFLLAGLGLLLSTPLLSFDRIATSHQLARLANGRVSPADFDYRALWFRFGQPGRAAIEKLATRSSDETVRNLAGETRKLTDPWQDGPAERAARAGHALDERLTILPAPVPLDERLRARLVRFDACGDVGDCLLHHVPGEDFAVVVAYPARSCAGCTPSVRLIWTVDGVWSDASQYLAEGDVAQAMAARIRTGDVVIRPVVRRQLFIGGEAVGETLPMAGNVPGKPDAP